MRREKNDNRKSSTLSGEELEKWQPVTEFGKKVKRGEETSIDPLLETGKRIMEVEIVDSLFPGIESELLLIGQSKGKFGGGQRRVFKQTQKKTREGNKPKFATIVVVGDRNGHVGIGYGKSKETVPAREKAIRNAKLGMMKVKRGCGSWESGDITPNTVPFKVTGKWGSTEITLIPAPKGKGLIVEKECKKILALAGYQDVWSRTKGQTKTKINLIYALVDALKKLSKIKVQEDFKKEYGVIDGAIKAE